MREKRIYWRRKGKKIIAEGIRKNKTIYLFTLPNPEIVLNSSLFPLKKQYEIREKIARLDIKEHDKKNGV